ncbi:phosphotransferase [Sphingomonas xanthus]|uniref:Phosphotransferase n=2 Tax=Sphingomonas xanthus TaxID=2594473 RepID=A0A516IU98_9SPHN|nr:phosphotransferase [Sphingomonas xanthus]
MIPPESAADFLDRHGWQGAEILPLAGDASFRRYFRVQCGDRRAVLMDAPPPHEDPRPFVAIADWLGQVGLVAPRVLAQDLDRGLLLLDDLGDSRMREALDENPQAERDLYETAVDVLVHLHRQAPMAGLLPHGLDEWLTELRLFPEWYLPAVESDPINLDEWDDAWRQVLEPVASDGLGPVTVLRDYHAENVMLVDGRGGIERFGLLDFQDALAGHPAYDLVSVLEDARRDVPPALERDMIDRYLAKAGVGSRFEAAYWALAAQRNTRILGVFCRLWKRDGKERYKQFQPRMWGLLERDLAQPGLEPVRSWFDSHVPHAFRASAWQADA